MCRERLPLRLNNEQKAFIVIQLACYASPSTVVDEVNEEFNIAVSRQAISRYDATRKAGETLSDELKELFFRTRTEFETSIKGIGIALQSFRLRELHRLYVRALRNSNLVEARACLEQAAKEVGGMFTNKRLLTFDSISNAREALEILRFEFAEALAAGEITDQQLSEMVAEDHGVDLAELLSQENDLPNVERSKRLIY